MDIARISIKDYDSANVKRYKDLRDEMKLLVVIDGIDHDSIRFKEMRLIAAIEKLHGVDVKE